MSHSCLISCLISCLHVGLVLETGNEGYIWKSQDLVSCMISCRGLGDLYVLSMSVGHQQPLLMIHKVPNRTYLSKQIEPWLHVEFDRIVFMQNTLGLKIFQGNTNFIGNVSSPSVGGSYEEDGLFKRIPPVWYP